MRMDQGQSTAKEACQMPSNQGIKRPARWLPYKSAPYYQIRQLYHSGLAGTRDITHTRESYVKVEWPAAAAVAERTMLCGKRGPNRDLSMHEDLHLKPGLPLSLVSWQIGT